MARRASLDLCRRKITCLGLSLLASGRTFVEEKNGPRQIEFPLAGQILAVANGKGFFYWTLGC